VRDHAPFDLLSPRPPQFSEAWAARGALAATPEVAVGAILGDLLEELAAKPGVGLARTPGGCIGGQQERIARTFVEHGTIVSAPIGIDAGTWLAGRQVAKLLKRERAAVRVRNPRRRTIIGPNHRAPSVLGRPHMMRHRESL